MSNNLPKFTIKQLLEAGVHFGHKTMRRNPKMSKYIHGNRDGISIINLNKTASSLYKTMIAAYEVAKNGGRILFVATKKQATLPVADAAKKCGQYYVNFRWLGGMLTNWKTVSQSIKTLKKIEEQLSGSDGVDYNKKEKLVLERKRLKLEQAIGGIKNMGGYPDLIFIIDTLKEELAVAEAQKLNIPIAAIVDSNSNPDGIAYPIPGNDDSAKAIKLYCNLISDSIIVGLRENMAAAGVDLTKFEDGTLPNLKVEKKEEKSEKKSEKRSEKKIIVSTENEEVSQDGDVNSDEKKSSKKPAAKKPVAKKSKENIKIKK